MFLNRSISDRNNEFHRELRESLAHPFYWSGVAIGMVFLLLGALGIVETAIFPFDALSIAGVSLVVLIMYHMGWLVQANNWFIVGFMWAIAFNMPFYGVNHPITALYLPVIILSGLLIGRIFQAMMVVLSSMFILVFALMEYAGENQPPIAVNDERELIGTIVFWLGLMTITGILVRIFAAYLEQAIATTRGQTMALANTIALITEDLDQDAVFGRVLQTTSDQLKADDTTLFMYDDQTDTLVARIYYVDGQVKQRDEMDDPTPIYHTNELPLWMELSKKKEIIQITDITNDTRLKYRTRLLEQGIRTILMIPLLLNNRVIGMITFNSRLRRNYLPEELELARALVGQLAVAIQISRLMQASRETAVIRERNRMAREIHDTLAQGFTGVIVQLESAEDILRAEPDEAITHLDKARQLARESLKEARRSVMALRPQALTDHTLPEALQTMIATMTSPMAPAIQWQREGVYQPLAPFVEAHLLRIAQEAVTNALKYADARTITVRLCSDAQIVRLWIQDDGKGFDKNAPYGGFGLVGMEERAEAIGTHVQITSTIGNGTTIGIEVQVE